MTQTTLCGFCRETYDVGDQSLVPDAEGLPLNQCAACARREARGSRKRDYPMFDRASADCLSVGRRMLAESTASDARYVDRWQPEDRVELVAWQPDDLVWPADA